MLQTLERGAKYPRRLSYPRKNVMAISTDHRPMCALFAALKWRACVWGFYYVFVAFSGFLDTRCLLPAEI